MPKPVDRPTSRYARDAAQLLGLLIRRARIERQMTVEGLAERAGLSRGLASRIEKGDLGCSVGAVFEAAAVVGLRLFDEDQRGMAGKLADAMSSNTLLPQAVRAPARVDDDF